MLHVFRPHICGGMWNLGLLATDESEICCDHFATELGEASCPAHVSFGLKLWLAPATILGYADLNEDPHEDEHAWRVHLLSGEVWTTLR